MSTTIANPAASQQEPITKQNFTYIVAREVTKTKHPDPTTGELKEGLEFGPWKSYPEGDDVEKQIAAGELEEKWRQTFALPDVNTKEGCSLLVPDEEEFVNIFSAGLNQKMKNRARTLPTTKDFAPVEGVIDLTEEANKRSERQRLSPADKLLKAFKESGLTAEKIAEILAMAQAAGLSS